MPTVQREDLSPAHEARLRALSENPDKAVARRAVLILRWHAGATQAEIAGEVGLSVSGVAHWLREYRERGLSIFDSVPASSPDSSVVDQPVVAPSIAVAPVVEPILDLTPEAVPEAAIEHAVPEKPRRGRKASAKPKPGVETPETQIAEPEAASDPAQAAPPVFESAPEPLTPTADQEVNQHDHPTADVSDVLPGAVIDESSITDVPPADETPIESIDNGSAEPVIGLLSARTRPKTSVRPSAPPPPPPMLPDIPVEVPAPRPVPDQSISNQAESRPGLRQNDNRRGRPNNRPNERNNPPPRVSPTITDSARSVNAAQPTILPAVVPPEPVAIVPPAPIRPVKPAQPNPTVRGLIEFYESDLKQAQHVAKLAAALFDATAETHRLHDRTRRVLEAGALLHNIALGQNADHYAARGRDLILETPLEGFNPEERRMIAMLVAFQRDRVAPEREAAYLALPAELRADTLALAAILRLAIGADESRTQTTEVAEVISEPDELAIGLSGASAGADGVTILDRADLWERLFGQRVSVYLAEGADGDLPAARSLAVPPALRDQMPDVSVTLNPSIDARNAYRQLALHYADRVDRLAARVRVGDQHKLAAFERELNRLADVLGLAGLTRFDHTLAWLREKARAARLAFTVLDRASVLADDPDQPEAGAIAAGLNHWRFAWRAAFEALDFARCDHLIGELRRELLTETHDQPGAALVGRIGMIAWERLAVLREAVEQGESVHKALSAAYRLQDALLYFRSLLGSEATQALDMLTPFESYLGAITTVQASMDSLDRDRFAEDSPEAQAIAAFRRAQAATLDELADNLPGLWNVVNSPVFRRTLALSLAQA